MHIYNRVFTRIDPPFRLVGRDIHRLPCIQKEAPRFRWNRWRHRLPRPARCQATFLGVVFKGLIAMLWPKCGSQCPVGASGRLERGWEFKIKQASRACDGNPCSSIIVMLRRTMTRVLRLGLQGGHRPVSSLAPAPPMAVPGARLARAAIGRLVNNQLPPLQSFLLARRSLFSASPRCAAVAAANIDADVGVLVEGSPEGLR